MDLPRTRGEGATSSGVEAWRVAIILSERASWPRPGRGSGAPTAVGPASRRLLGRTDIAPGSACGPADVGRTALPRGYHSCTGSAGPGRTACPSTWGLPRRRAQLTQGGPAPRAQVQVGAGLDVPGRGTGPVAQGRTSRGGSSEPCSRCRRGATWGGRTAPQKADDTCDKGAQAPGPGSAGALTGWWCKTPPAPPARRYRDGLRRMTVEVRSRRGLM